MTNVTIKNNSTKQEEPVHKVGNWYHLRDVYDVERIAVLIAICGHIFLICQDGDYWCGNSTMPDNCYNITEHEFMMLAGEGTKYMLLKNITITVE